MTVDRNITVRLEPRYAWWLMPYLRTLEFFCVVCATEPNPEKLSRVIKRAVRVRVVRENQGANRG